MLEIKNLNIEFHDRQVPETVVYGLNLSVGQGEILGLVGESGSGKTMTALAVAGLLRRHDMEKTGEIIYDGFNLLECSRDELRSIQGNEIAMVFQEPMTCLNPVLRIGWQVEEALRIHTQLSKEERKRQALEVLDKVELSDPERVYRAFPHELSGGMRQRVMIAAAIICGPRLLIADEPTTALDVTIQAQIVKLLLRINKESGMAILFISHDLSLVRQLCSRVAVMQGGYLVEQGLVESVFENPQEEYTWELIRAIPRVERRQVGDKT